MPIELVKLAVADPSDVANAAVMSVTQEGGEGATRQVFTTESVDAVIEDNQRLADVFDFSLSVAGLRNTSNATKLKSFVANQTKVIVSGYTIDGHILQGSGYLGYRRGLGETYLTDIVELRTRGQYGYDSNGNSIPGIMLFTNALAQYNVLEGTSTLMNGFPAVADISESFSAPVQNIERTGGTTVWFSSEYIYFPFGGVELTFSIDVTDATLGGGQKFIRVQAADASLSSIGTGPSDPFTTNGVKSVSYTLPAGTVYVRGGVSPGSQDLDEPDILEFKHPSIRLNGGVSFTLQ